MNLIFTLDDNNAVKFGDKRQSLDKEVAKRILQFTESTSADFIYIKNESNSFFDFPDLNLTKLKIFEDFDSLPRNATIFLEETVSRNILSHVDKIVIFRWGKKYPSQIKDRLILNSDIFTKVSSTPFPTSTHPDMQIEVYF